MTDRDLLHIAFFLETNTPTVTPFLPSLHWLTVHFRRVDGYYVFAFKPQELRESLRRSLSRSVKYQKFSYKLLSLLTSCFTFFCVCVWLYWCSCCSDCRTAFCNTFEECFWNNHDYFYWQTWRVILGSYFFCGHQLPTPITPCSLNSIIKRLLQQIQQKKNVIGVYPKSCESRWSSLGQEIELFPHTLVEELTAHRMYCTWAH